MKLADIALRIREHLRRFADDPAIARRLYTGPDGKERVQTLYWATHAWRGGSRIKVKYVSYQGEISLTKAEAIQYLEWLDAGNVGTHWRAAEAGERRGED